MPCAYHHQFEANCCAYNPLERYPARPSWGDLQAEENRREAELDEEDRRAKRRRGEPVEGE